MSDPSSNNTPMNPYFTPFPRTSSKVVFSRRTVWLFTALVRSPTMYLLNPISLALASRVTARFRSSSQRKVMFPRGILNKCHNFHFFQPKSRNQELRLSCHCFAF
jgi:hypothetical protein